MRGISFAAALATIMIGAVHSQTPPPAPGKAPEAGLEELLTAALRNNPDILVADAKVREAELELRRCKMQVVNNIAAARNKVMEARQIADLKSQDFHYQNELRKKGVTTDADHRQSEAQLAQAKMAVVQAEAVLDSLTGATAQKLGTTLRIPETIPPASAPLPDDGRRPPRQPHPAMADKIRQALDGSVKSVQVENVPLQEAINYYRELSNQVPFVTGFGDPPGAQVTLKLNKELPLGAHFQALQDVAPGLQIFVRDYGFFFTFDNPPDDGVPYLDFWHNTKAKAVERKPQQ
jgi:hypothetical protein